VGELAFCLPHLTTRGADQLTAQNRAQIDAEMERNARLRKILGLLEIDTPLDSEEVVDAKLLERACRR
jgi:hypothetical protein